MDSKNITGLSQEKKCIIEPLIRQQSDSDLSTVYSDYSPLSTFSPQSVDTICLSQDNQMKNKSDENLTNNRFYQRGRARKQATDHKMVKRVFESLM